MDDRIEIRAEEVARRHDEWTAGWHGAGEGAAADGLMELVRRNHRANFDLWHEEDKARDPEATDAEIARVKRAIDRLNQQRNDVAEQMDAALLERLSGVHAEGAPLHSETPGMMIDRMSILALKIFHTREEVSRASASAEHRARNGQRLLVLEEQRTDLQGCLKEMWREARDGRRRFKMYRQMKMYNDPDLNPAVYGRGERRSKG